MPLSTEPSKNIRPGSSEDAIMASDGGTLEALGVTVVDDDCLPVATEGRLNTSILPSPAVSDAFGRMRFSEPFNVFESKQLFDNAPIFWNEALVSGADITSSWSQEKAATTITSTLNTAGKFVRQTYERMNYQPGKSQLILMTGVLNLSGGGTGVAASIGQFDDDNGVFFSHTDGVGSVTIRSGVSGSPVDNRFIQSAWNIDKMDGTGPSGITIDFSKTQIFIMDYEWLGVGRVRFGFGINGTIVYCHSVDHSNTVSEVYMSSPNLPLRYELITTGSSPASSMLTICTAITSEGGFNNLGLRRRKSTGAVALSATTAGTVYALIGIRLKTTHLGAVVRQELASLLVDSNDTFEWILLVNPDVADTFTYSDEDDSAVQTAVGVTANEVTNGVDIAGGWVSKVSNIAMSLDSARYLGCAIDGTLDEIVLCVRPVSNNAVIRGSLSWREMP